MIDELFDIQKEVDEIIKEKCLISDFRNTLFKRKIAFKVELAELANEIGVFKYWKKSHKRDDNRIKNEWADCLAFLISVSVTETDCLPNIDFDFIENNIVDLTDKEMWINRKINYLLKSELDWFNVGLNSVFQDLYEIGVLCGYSIDELNNTYIIKSKENIRRAKEGY